MIKLLEGIRVLECAVLPTGDNTSRLLGDLGADVIKVERPGVGDYLRDLGGTITPRHSALHLLANRNKRSVTLNLRSEQGREIFFELLRTADIFVDGFAGDACDRLGIGYQAQRAVKPDIIYCQASGFGAHGPYGQIPVHGYMMGGVAGDVIVEVGEDDLVRQRPTSEADRWPGGDGPKWPGQVDAPFSAAIFAALTAVSALKYRDE